MPGIVLILYFEVDERDIAVLSRISESRGDRQILSKHSIQSVMKFNSSISNKACFAQ